MKTKILIFVLTIIIASTLLSCSKNQKFKDLDFTNPDIYAYVNDTPIYESEMKKYIQIKTKIMENYKTDPYGMLEHQAGAKAENISYSTFAHKAEQYIKSNKIEDYLIVQIIKLELDGAWRKKPEYFKMVNATVDEDISGLKFRIENQPDDPLIRLFKEIAEEDNVTVNEVIENIYKPYVYSTYEYEGYYKYFLDNIYSGDVYDMGNMTRSEFIKHSLRLISECNHYLEQVLYEQYTITYRPASTQGSNIKCPIG